MISERKKVENKLWKIQDKRNRKTLRTGEKFNLTSFDEIAKTSEQNLIA